MNLKTSKCRNSLTHFFDTTTFQLLTIVVFNLITYMQNWLLDLPSLASYPGFYLVCQIQDLVLLNFAFRFSISRFQKLNSFLTAKFKPSWNCFGDPLKTRHLFHTNIINTIKISDEPGNSCAGPVTANITSLLVYTATRDKVNCTLVWKDPERRTLDTNNDTNS